MSGSKDYPVTSTKRIELNNNTEYQQPATTTNQQTTNRKKLSTQSSTTDLKAETPVGLLWPCPPRDTTLVQTTCCNNIFGHVHPETLHYTSTLLTVVSLAMSTQKTLIIDDYLCRPFS